MSCDSIAVIRAKISNEVFAKLLRMVDIQTSLTLTCQKEGINIFYLQNSHDNRLSFQMGGIYFNVNRTPTGFDVNASGSRWDTEEMENMKEKVLQSINRVGTLKLAQAVNAFLKIKGYSVTESTTNKAGVVINFQSKE